MGNGEILPEVPPTLRKHSPSLVPKRGIRTDGAAGSSKDGAASRIARNRSRSWSSTTVPLVRQKLQVDHRDRPGFPGGAGGRPLRGGVRCCASPYPGVIVLDVEMPRMDGLTFLRKLMRQHPLPVVLCTAQAERAVTALEMGAIEVIAKPDWNDASRLTEWSQSLLESIRNAARAGRLPFRDDRPAAGDGPPAFGRRDSCPRFRIRLAPG